jgi:hypothetical protein
MVSPEGCIGQGLISVVMTLPAQHRGQQASKLQVRTLPSSWNKMHVLFPSIHGEEPKCGPICIPSCAVIVRTRYSGLCTRCKQAGKLTCVLQGFSAQAVYASQQPNALSHA